MKNKLIIVLICLITLTSCANAGKCNLDNESNVNMTSFSTISSANFNSNEYRYAVYDLTGNQPKWLGDFYIPDNVNGSQVSIYKCYDSSNAEYFYVTQEDFIGCHQRDSYVKKIQLYSHGLEYTCVVSKKSYKNDDTNCFYMLNNNGNVTSGYDNGETAINDYIKQYKVINIFSINKDEYNIADFSFEPTVENKRKVENYDSSSYSVSI